LLTKTEEQHVDALSRAILSVKSDVERQANGFALGNRVIFENIVIRLGFHPEHPHAKHSRIFESRSVGKGMLHFIVPAEDELGKPTYTFEYGIATAEDVSSVHWQPVISLGNTELFISGLPSATIIAIHYAVTVIPSRKRKTVVSGAGDVKTAAPVSTANKMITILPINNSKKVQIAHGVNYNHFSDVIFVVVL
jgi:hypothetical protein